ncbi:MAG: hypothetical protein U0229_21785 [Anaeromyxobacter sp.]
MQPRVRSVLALVAAAAVGGLATWGLLTLTPAPRPEVPDTTARPSPAYPGGKPIDAAAIQSGTLAVERMPPEVTGALEVHGAELVKAEKELATKQARITGLCAPGSAIRVVGEDGSVVCQRLPRGVASVSAVGATPRISSSGTMQGTVPGAVGRYQTSGDDDFLVAPIALPDGAIVTGLSYMYWDVDEKVDGGAYLYRSDDTVIAGVATQGAKAEVRVAETDRTDATARRVDNAGFAYHVYMQTSSAAGASLMPIAVSVTYRLP